MLKRTFDLVTAICLLTIATPLLVLAMVAIRLTMGDPVIFRQVRPGYLGKPFDIYKLRTMSDDRDAKGVLLPDAERLTFAGSFIRRMSIDELPQLINVIKGDMSLVGPRPLLMEYLPLYSPDQARRHDVRPGITGWAQVNGRNALCWEDRLRLDVWYVDHSSVWLDMKILFMTLARVLSARGVSQPGSATMSKFTGSGKPEHHA